MKSVIILPVNREIPTPFEESSLKNYVKMLAARHPVHIVCPESLDVWAYKEIIGEADINKIEFSRVPDEYMESLAAYNEKLSLSPLIYEMFSDYGYMLIAQLDTWVFKDELNEWANAGYDYIGAPWISGLEPLEPGRTDTSWGYPSGNSGFNLRNIKRFLEVTQKLTHEQWQEMKRCGCYDDVWICNCISRWFDLVIAPPPTAIKFSMEWSPGAAYEQNGKRLPFGAHYILKADAEFWSRFIPNLPELARAEGYKRMTCGKAAKELCTWFRRGGMTDGRDMPAIVYKHDEQYGWTQYMGAYPLPQWKIKLLRFMSSLILSKGKRRKFREELVSRSGGISLGQHMSGINLPRKPLGANRYLCCEILHDSIDFEENHLRPFCWRPTLNVPKFQYDGGPLNKTILEEYFKKFPDIIQENPKRCEGCRFAYYADEPQQGDLRLAKFNHVMLNPHRWFCNLKCVYCEWFGYTHEIPEGVKDPYPLTPSVEFLIKNNLLAKDCQFAWGGGESSILPEFESLARMIYDAGYKQVLNSNGTKFSPVWAYVLSKDSRTYFNISPDSGVRETYLKIKRGDYYGAVWENIAKYQAAAKNPASFRVKYVIQNENCSETEIEAFIEKCKQAKIKMIEISLEQRTTDEHGVPEKWTQAARYMRALAVKNGMEVEHMTLWNPCLGADLANMQLLELGSGEFSFSRLSQKSK